MRAFARELWAPPILHAGGPAEKHLASLESKIQTKGKLQSSEFQEHWRALAVQGVLLGRQGFSCVYCGRDLLKPTIDDVEHFRPKAEVTEAKGHAGYWWLAYSMENLFLSCTICNREYKRNCFPLAEESSRADHKKRLQVSSESRLLLDPMLDPVEELFVTERKATRVRIVAAPGLQASRRRQVESTCDLLHLNQRDDLLRGWLMTMEQVLKAIESGDEKFAKRAACRVSPFSIVARDLLREERPEWLPSEMDELEACFQGLCNALNRAAALAEDSVQSSEAYRLMERSLWALAMLLSSKWHGREAQLADWLDFVGIGTEVTKRRNQLRVV